MNTQRIDLNLLRTFIEVADQKGFSGAARKLKLQRSSVSRAIASLEEALGVQLFSRTTRHVALTTAGTALYTKVASEVTALQLAVQNLPERESEPSGLLRITAPHDLANFMLAPILAGFSLRFPKVTIDAVLTNEVLDLVADGIDIAIRPAGQSLPDSTLIARKLTTLEGHLFAAPSYLARAGTPRHVEDLRKHNWIASPMGSSTPELLKNKCHTTLRVNDVTFSAQCAIAGMGIALLPEYIVLEDVLQGRLVRVLSHFTLTGGACYLLRPQAEHISRKVRAFSDYLVASLAARLSE